MLKIFKQPLNQEDTVRYPERDEITIEWLRSPSCSGTSWRAHDVLNGGYMNLVERGLLPQVIDLIDNSGNTTMHWVCYWQPALKFTPKEFLTPKYLLVKNLCGENALEFAISMGVEPEDIPWEKFPAMKWSAHLDELRRDIFRCDKHLELVRAIESVRQLKEKEGIQMA
jgi:hypothetical protein